MQPAITRNDAAYDTYRRGFNLAVEHRPEFIVEAVNAADVASAVRFAADEGLPVAVMNTGHGPSVPADGAVLIRTGGMRSVSIDPKRRTARVEGGVRWRAVIDAAARHQLAPLNGSSPDVGAVGYTLGGGVGLLARRFGFAADHVRGFDVVTADGQVRQVSATSEPDLFWALRGAGANFGVVTAMEIDLFPVAELLGGELAFGPELTDDVLGTYVEWTKNVPETVASSVLLLEYPNDASVPHHLRGQRVAHVRVAYSGDAPAEGRELFEPLRRIGPRLVDTIREMPYQDVGTIHHDPTDQPVPAFDRNTLLGELDQRAASVLAAHAGRSDGAPFVAELRAWGGALSRQPSVPNAVGGREAAFSLLAIGEPEPESRCRRDQLLDAMQPWSMDMTYPNFNGVEDTAPEAVRRAYRTEDYERLARLKAAYDPRNMFRINFNIPPLRTRRDEGSGATSPAAWSIAAEGLCRRATGRW